MLLAISLALSACAHTPRWSAGDQWAFAGAVGCQTTDAVQTSMAMDDGYREGNPLVGSHPSNEKIAGLKVAGLGYLWALEDSMADHSNRTAISLAVTTICSLVVAHNYKVTH